jgi:hypothetical protein
LEKKDADFDTGCHSALPANTGPAMIAQSQRDSKKTVLFIRNGFKKLILY